MTASGRSTRLLALGLCVVCALAVLVRLPRWTRGPDEAYIIAVEDAWHGRLGLANYDDEAMAARTGAITEGRIRNFLSPTPPSIAVVLSPLAWIPAGARPVVWLALNVIAFLTTCWLLARVMSWPARKPWLGLGGAAAVLLSEPLAENLSRGQVYLLLMPAAAGVLVATMTGRPAGAIGLAVCTAAKLWGGAVWLTWVAARMWLPLAAAAALTAILMLAAFYAAGLETWSYYFRTVLPQWLSTPKMTVTAYQTIPSMLAHFLRADPHWNPDPITNRPALCLTLTLLSGGVLLVITVWRSAREEHRLAAVAAAIVLAVLLSPVGEQYHYLLVVPSIAIAMELAGLRVNVRTAMLTLAVLLLFLPFPFKSPELARVAGGIFAYPRVAGALMLWFLVISSRAGSDPTREPL
jgi:hypothetical protein